VSVGQSFASRVEEAAWEMFLERAATKDFALVRHNWAFALGISERVLAKYLMKWQSEGRLRLEYRHKQSAICHLTMMPIAKYAHFAKVADGVYGITIDHEPDPEDKYAYEDALPF
jgi:hypothetical protein